MPRGTWNEYWPEVRGSCDENESGLDYLIWCFDRRLTANKRDPNLHYLAIQNYGIDLNPKLLGMD